MHISEIKITVEYKIEILSTNKDVPESEYVRFAEWIKDFIVLHGKGKYDRVYWKEDGERYDPINVQFMATEIKSLNEVIA